MKYDPPFLGMNLLAWVLDGDVEPVFASHVRRADPFLIDPVDPERSVIRRAVNAEETMWKLDCPILFSNIDAALTALTTSLFRDCETVVVGNRIVGFADDGRWFNETSRAFELVRLPDNHGTAGFTLHFQRPSRFEER